MLAAAHKEARFLTFKPYANYFKGETVSNVFLFDHKEDHETWRKLDFFFVQGQSFFPVSVSLTNDENEVVPQNCLEMTNNMIFWCFFSYN